MPDHRSDAKTVVALDVGGTSVKSGIVTRTDSPLDTGSVTHRHNDRIDAHSEAEAIVGLLAGIIEARREQSRTSDSTSLAVGIAFPGPFDYDAGVPRLTHKFAAINGLDLGAAIRDHLERPVGPITFAHDAVAAAVGEVEASGSPGTVLMITLGTGLGSAVIIDGQPWPEGDQPTELWTQTTDDGRTADERFGAAGLAAALGTTADRLAVATAQPSPALTNWAAGLGSFLSEQARRFAATEVIVGGGVAAAYDQFAPGLAATLTLPCRHARLGSDAALLGISRLALERSGG